MLQIYNTPANIWEDYSNLHLATQLSDHSSQMEHTTIWLNASESKTISCIQHHIHNVRKFPVDSVKVISLLLFLSDALWVWVDFPKKTWILKKELNRTYNFISPCSSVPRSASFSRLSTEPSSVRSASGSDSGSLHKHDLISALVSPSSRKWINVMYDRHRVSHSMYSHHALNIQRYSKPIISIFNMIMNWMVTSHTHFSIQMKSTLGKRKHNQVVFCKCNKMLIFNFSEIVSFIENMAYPKPPLQSKVTPVDRIKNHRCDEKISRYYQEKGFPNT